MFRYREIWLFGQVVQKRLSSSSSTIHKHNPVFQKLLTEFTDVSYVAKIVNEEEVRDVDYKEWKSRITILKSHGFEDADCFKMISLYPSLLKIPEAHLKSNVKQWVDADLGIKNTQLILIKHPHLLEVGDDVIRKRLPKLRIYFRTDSSLSQMIINSPNVLYDDWKQLLLKIDYLLKKRKFKMGDVLKSCALCKDFNFIKLRFDVAEKCGVYKQKHLMPHEETKHQKQTQNNLKLKYILQDKDENFARLVAKITLEEYLAAKNLFYEEDEENSLDSDSDDSDD